MATKVRTSPAIGSITVSESRRIREKTPAFHCAGAVPTCTAISPTRAFTVSKSPDRLSMIQPISSSFSQFVIQSVFNGDLVVAGSGACLASVSSAAARCGLSGLEWAIGIPGSVGGAVRMNAGAFGGAISDRLLYADVLRGGAVVRLGRGELGFSYRHSAIADDDVVIAAAFLLDKISAAVTLARCGEYTERRRSKQPSGKSAGSVFKNPSGISVGKVLDGAGLKGLRNGGAVISPVHANIIVNTGDATADDVCGLIRIMKGELEARGIEAKEEIIYVGGFKNGVLGRLPHAYDIQQKGR